MHGLLKILTENIVSLVNDNLIFTGLIICPSRELAKQTHDIIKHYTDNLRRAHCPEIRSCLAIGGLPVSECLDVINRLVNDAF